jgi:hypothetical protein
MNELMMYECFCLYCIKDVKLQANFLSASFFLLFFYLQEQNIDLLLLQERMHLQNGGRVEGEDKAS